MNVVFLSPHFPPNFYLFCAALRKHGITALGIADSPFEHLREELRSSLTGYYRVHDMHNYGELVNALNYFTDRYGRIDRLDSLNEYWLTTEAKLRTDFNIPGIKSDTITDMRLKSRMKNIFNSAGVDSARGILVTALGPARAFISEAGYPVIAKPDGGVGAADTFKLTSDAELDRFFQSGPKVPYYLEEFIEGRMFTFDGLTDRDGNLVFYTSHTYSQGIMETVNDDLDIFYYSLRDIPSDLEAEGLKLLKAFDVRERFFHFEFFRTASNKIKALEVNMRPPGGLTTDMFNFACDIDVYDLWARILSEGTADFDFKRKYHCCYISRKFNKKYALNGQDILQRFKDMLVHHEKINSAFGRALGDYGYLLRSESRDDILSAAETIQKKA